LEGWEDHDVHYFGLIINTSITVYLLVSHGSLQVHKWKWNHYYQIWNPRHVQKDAVVQTETTHCIWHIVILIVGSGFLTIKNLCYWTGLSSHSPYNLLVHPNQKNELVTLGKSTFGKTWVYSKLDGWTIFQVTSSPLAPFTFGFSLPQQEESLNVEAKCSTWSMALVPAHWAELGNRCWKLIKASIQSNGHQFFTTSTCDPRFKEPLARSCTLFRYEECYNFF
jgi:hypothetical protein